MSVLNSAKFGKTKRVHSSFVCRGKKVLDIHMGHFLYIVMLYCVNSVINLFHL